MRFNTARSVSGKLASIAGLLLITFLLSACDGETEQRDDSIDLSPDGWVEFDNGVVLFDEANFGEDLSKYKSEHPDLVLTGIVAHTNAGYVKHIWVNFEEKSDLGVLPDE